MINLLRIVSPGVMRRRSTTKTDPLVEALRESNGSMRLGDDPGCVWIRFPDEAWEVIKLAIYRDSEGSVADPEGSDPLTFTCWSCGKESRTDKHWRKWLKKHPDGRPLCAACATSGGLGPYT